MSASVAMKVVKNGPPPTSCGECQRRKQKVSTGIPFSTMVPGRDLTRFSSAVVSGPATIVRPGKSHISATSLPESLLFRRGVTVLLQLAGGY